MTLPGWGTSGRGGWRPSLVSDPPSASMQVAEVTNYRSELWDDGEWEAVRPLTQDGCRAGTELAGRTGLLD